MVIDWLNNILWFAGGMAFTIGTSLIFVTWQNRKAKKAG